MSPLSKLVVHVGLAQSGSTTLQQHIFNRRDFGFALLSSDRIATLRKYVMDPLAGEFDAAKCTEFFSQQFVAYQDDDLVPVVSGEGLADKFLPMQDNLHAEVYAHRLHAAFGQCKIILIIREQTSHLVSKYRKNLEIKGRANVSLSSFLRDEQLVHRVQTDCDSVFLPIFKHDNLVKIYWQLFGRENTLVIPLEMMFQQPGSFVRRLNAFCGSKIPSDFAVPRANAHGVRGLSSFYRSYNTVYSPMSISLLWFLNPRRSWGRRWRGHASFVGRTSNSIQKRMVSLLRSMRVITDAKIAREKERQLAEVRSMLGAYYADSNRNLSQMIGIDLAALGYNVGEQQAMVSGRKPSRSVDSTPPGRPVVSSVDLG